MNILVYKPALLTGILLGIPLGIILASAVIAFIQYKFLARSKKYK